MSDNVAPLEELDSTGVISEEEEPSSDASWFTEDASFDVPVRGDIREGTIVSIGRSEILVDIGAKSEGVIDRSETERMSSSERSNLVEGESVQVYVVNPEAVSYTHLTLPTTPYV